MDLLSQQQIQQVSSAVHGLNPSQLAWVSGYLSGLSAQTDYSSSSTPFPLAAPANASITILYGSQTGNSQRIAEELHSAFLANGSQVSLSNLLDYRPAQLKKEQNVLFVISTQGNGEPPDEARAFFNYIESNRAPQLDKLEYAVLGLGDSSYDDYCETSCVLDKRLESLGASRLLERVDADIDFEEVAGLWQKDILQQLKPDAETSALTLAPAASSVASATTRWSEAKPYQAEVLSMTNLTAEGSEQEVYHLELAVDDYGQGYQPGDILAVLPENQVDLVSSIIAQTGLNRNETVFIKDRSLSLFDALLTAVEISKLTPKVVKTYAEKSTSESLHGLVVDKQKLKSTIENKDLLDLLQTYPTTLSAQQLVDCLRPLISRQYSIASSNEIQTDEVHILVKPVAYEHGDRSHFGAASNWIKQRQAGDTVPVHIMANRGFKLPKNHEDKIIMIGAGTGVAPYRSFLFEREAQAVKGNSWLFFGEQRFQTDFLYQTDWQHFLKTGVLERMNVAFSRDHQEKVYVQHQLLKEAETLYQWLEAGATLYVCGDMNRMAADVHQALVQIVSEQSSRSQEEAESWLEELQLGRRYQRDVY